MKTGVTNLELHEYFQNGCIRAKDSMMDYSHDQTYVYYGLESGYKQYRRIDFENDLDMYTHLGLHKCYAEVYALTYVHPEYGLVVVEDHHENYLVELRETEYTDSFLRLLKRRGHRAEIVGERMFVCIWKEIKKGR